MTDLRSMTIDTAPIPNRARNALSMEGRYKTLADIERAPDEELMRIRRLGLKSIVETRRIIERLKSGEQDEIEWARNHRNLIRAILAGEAEITIR